MAGRPSVWAPSSRSPARGGLPVAARPGGGVDGEHGWPRGWPVRYQQVAHHFVVDSFQDRALSRLPWLRPKAGSRLSVGTELTGAGAHKAASHSSNAAQHYLYPKERQCGKRVGEPTRSSDDSSTGCDEPSHEESSGAMAWCRWKASTWRFRALLTPLLRWARVRIEKH